MQFPVFIELRRSRLLDAAVLGCHAIAIACVLASPLLLWILIPFIGVSAWRIFHRQGFVSVQLTAAGELICISPDSTQREFKVLPCSTVSRNLIVLQLSADETKCRSHLVLLPDQMGATQFRQLLLWLRWGIKTDVRTSA